MSLIDPCASVHFHLQEGIRNSASLSFCYNSQCISWYLVSFTVHYLASGINHSTSPGLWCDLLCRAWFLVYLTGAFLDNFSLVDTWWIIESIAAKTDGWQKETFQDQVWCIKQHMGYTGQKKEKIIIKFSKGSLKLFFFKLNFFPNWLGPPPQNLNLNF